MVSMVVLRCELYNLLFQFLLVWLYYIIGDLLYIEAKMSLLLSQLYCAYIKYLIKFIKKSKVLSIRISEVTRQIKKMKNKDLFAHYENFDAMISQIIQMFENNDFCRKFRIHQNFIYMIFLDLVKIYNVFYILTMETLDRYKKMSVSEMNKALVLYKNFCNFTETLKKEANTIPMLFGFTFKEPNYYKPDSNKERAMKNALRDKETGGSGFGGDDGYGDEGFGDEVPEFEDPVDRADFEEDKDDDGEDSDEDYQFDLLSDAKKQEQMASVHGAPRRGHTMMPPKKEKIKVDDFNTAALDDLLGGGNKPGRKSDIPRTSSNQPEEDEWDPFADKQENVYSTQQPAQVPQSNNKGNEGGASGNIFGDDDDMWSGNQASNQHPQTVQEQKQTLDDILGGGDDMGGNQSTSAQGRSQSMAVPNNDYDMLKNLYNTSSTPAQQPMGGNQQDYFNTGMGGGYGNMGGGMQNMGTYNQGYNQGYNTGMGGYGQNPPANQFNTGYANYGDYSTGGYGGQGNLEAGYPQNPHNYGTYGGGYNQNMMGGGYGGYNQPQNPGFNTSAPGNQNNQQNSDFDPFS